MSQQQENNKRKSSPGDSLSLLGFIASVHATALTPFIRRGFGIRANEWNGVGAMILIILWWCGAPHDPVMGYYLICWFLALLFQKAYTLRRIRQGDKIHSRYWGDPWLAKFVPFCRSDATARRFEPGMCFLIGLSLIGVSEALAALWICGFVSLTVVLCMERVVTEARLQAMDDAEIEGQYYAGLRNRRGEDW